MISVVILPFSRHHPSGHRETTDVGADPGWSIGRVKSGRVWSACSNYRRTRKIKRRNSPGRDAMFPSSKGCWKGGYKGGSELFLTALFSPHWPDLTTAIPVPPATRDVHAQTFLDVAGLAGKVQ